MHLDRDERNIVNEEMSGSPGNYRDHGNNVFSLIIPILNLERNDSICIEHLYQDSLLLLVIAGKTFVFTG